jgi:HrpA-like RNA helicase
VELFWSNSAGYRRVVSLTPRFSRAITLASILAERDAFLSPISAKAEADAIKDQWSSRSAGYRSDSFAILNAFEVWLPLQERGMYREANAFCQENFLSKQTMLSIMASRSQLYEALRHANILGAFVDSGSMPWAPRRRADVVNVPAALDENAQSLPVRAALIAIGSAPNFAIRTNPKLCRTAQHKVSSL